MRVGGGGRPGSIASAHIPVVLWVDEQLTASVAAGPPLPTPRPVSRPSEITLLRQAMEVRVEEAGRERRGLSGEPVMLSSEPEEVRSEEDTGIYE